GLPRRPARALPLPPSTPSSLTPAAKPTPKSMFGLLAPLLPGTVPPPFGGLLGTQLLRSRADPPRDGRLVGINHFGDLVNALALSVPRPPLPPPHPVSPGPAAAGAENPVRS